MMMRMVHQKHGQSLFTAERDSADWMFDPDLFSSYILMYGPFEVDACADDEGRNAQCKRFWSPSDSYNCHSWAGQKVWCNPPFQEIAEVLDNAVASYYEDVEKTLVMLVLPDWPDARWWPHVTASELCHCVGHYPAGTQLFTAPPTGKGGRRVMTPTKWGVCMVVLGRGWRNGICLPWAPWPPVPVPTIPRVPAKPFDAPAMEQPPVNPELDEKATRDISRLVDRYADILASGGQRGRTNIVTHGINTEGRAPIKQRPHRLSAGEVLGRYKHREKKC